VGVEGKDKIFCPIQQSNTKKKKNTSQNIKQIQDAIFLQSVEQRKFYIAKKTSEMIKKTKRRNYVIIFCFY
jgi:hypothetical protein